MTLWQNLDRGIMSGSECLGRALRASGIIRGLGFRQNEIMVRKRDRLNRTPAALKILKTEKTPGD